MRCLKTVMETYSTYTAIMLICHNEPAALRRLHWESGLARSRPSSLLHHLFIVVGHAVLYGCVRTASVYSVHPLCAYLSLPSFVVLFSCLSSPLHPRFFRLLNMQVRVTHWLFMAHFGCIVRPMHLGGTAAEWNRGENGRRRASTEQVGVRRCDTKHPHNSEELLELNVMSKMSWKKTM